MDLDRIRQPNQHGQRKDRHSKGERDPEAAPHVAIFAVVLFGQRIERLQRHAADRTRPGPHLPDLRIHGAGVDRVLRSFGNRRVSGVQVFFGIGLELVAAFGIAEEELLPVVMGVVALFPRLCGVDLHPADRIRRFGRLDIVLGIGFELGEALRIAEDIFVTVMVGDVALGAWAFGRDHHSANEIADFFGGCCLGRGDVRHAWNIPL